MLLLLVLPAPASASDLELRVARLLRVAGFKTAAVALFGRGRLAIFSALASVLVATVLASLAATALVGRLRATELLRDE